GRPVSAPDGCFVMDRSGGIMSFGRDGQRAWSINLGAEVVGEPMIAGGAVWLLTRDGTLHVRSRSDGAKRERRSLGVLPSGGLVWVGTAPLVAAARGTIRPLLREGMPAK